MCLQGGSQGARLTHSHERQYHYVLQSLTLWREISHEVRGRLGAGLLARTRCPVATVVLAQSGARAAPTQPRALAARRL